MESEKGREEKRKGDQFDKRNEEGSLIENEQLAATEARYFS